MEEVKTGGGKEFVYSVVWAVILLFIGDMIVTALPSYKIIGVIITILMFGVLAFFALTRYSAVYTYTLKKTRFAAVRKIGYRLKEVSFYTSDVVSVTRKKPDCRVQTVYRMHTSVFSRKNLWYVVYRTGETKNMLVCAVSEKMARSLRGGE